MRLIIALIIIAGLAAATVFLTDDPGRVEIVWQGWQIETSVGVLIAAAALAALTVALALRLIFLIFGSPAAFMRRRRERRRRAGYQALTRGMVAVAAGDPQEARRYARRAEALLAEPPLTLLLSAQAAQIGGDELAAKKFFTAMLDRPETEFLGLRGLLNQALRDGDRTTARRLARRAVELRPDTAWAASNLFDLEVRDRRWEAALAALDKAAKRRFIAPDATRHHRGVILHELSRAATTRGEAQRALELAGEAQSLTPDLAATAAHHARLLLAAGKAGRAERMIERAWRTAPHPELAQIYGETRKNETALGRMARYERLAAHNQAARESHLSVAEAAIAAELWGEARRHLDRALATEPPAFASLPANSGPTNSGAAPPQLPVAENPTDSGSWATPRLCLMMARVEDAEHDDPARIREWLDRAVHALPDPRYVCANCGGDSGEWHALCPRCGAFDTLAWRTPAWRSTSAAPLVTFGAPAETPAAPVGQARPATAASASTLPAIDPAAGG
ncbi:MAG TPA: heme biosynthesis HemY N-terminal domain-containing protein [Stellaceae bacterium]|nr:heme biosynthesis HemY N-terminal domain-containing protein [Stellaceae bacterium]